MTLSSLSIERPVLASVMSITILLFGIIGFTYLGVREYPSVESPLISVVTDYVGANAEVIESQITEPLEESINGIAGIKSISSVSSDGRSTISVEFNLGVDLDNAANDVRDRVSRAMRFLPPDAEPPVVSKSDADASTILAMTIQSDKRDLLNLTELADNVFKERLQTIPGVSRLQVWGSKEYSMRLEMDPAKMAAHNISPLDVQRALTAENVELPSGKIEGYRTELTIRTFGQLRTTEEFNSLIVKEDGDVIVRFRDIGTASLSALNKRTLLRGNDKIPMVGIAVTPLPGANYVEVADEFYKRVEQIEKEIPADLQLGYAFDNTIPIRDAIDEVQLTIIIAFCLVVLVIFLFLREWRTTLIPMVAMPVSLIGVFFLMYLLGYSVNILTLLAIVLATGLVVDDAIVMMENIYQKIEKGVPAIQAGHEGSREIFFAIIATTIALVAVFLPVIFLSGVTGRLFREFGIVVAGAVIISTFVSLTLTPMLTTRILKGRKKHGLLYRKTEPFFTWLTNFYRRSLKAFLKVNWLAPVLIAAAAAAIYGLASLLPSELAPMEDKSQFRIIATAPEGTSYELMDSYMESVLEVVESIPEKRAYISVTSPGFGSSTSINSGFVFVSLVQPDKRERSQDEIVKSVFPRLASRNFARSFPVQSQTIEVGRSLRGLPVQFVLQAPDIDRLRDVLPGFVSKAENHPAFSVIDVDLKFTKPELTIEIDRDRANTLGVSVQDVAETLQLYFAGQRFGFFILNGKQYQVVGEAVRVSRDEPIDLSMATVRSKDGSLIKLSSVTRMSERSSPPQLFRFNRYTSATVSADLNEGYTIGMGIDAMQEIADEMLDESYSTALAGSSKEFVESTGNLNFAFVLALVLVFLALAAQFESFVDPLIIMFTVPLALLGALLSLWIFGHTINIFSQIGIIVLVGIVTKNGILIVEFANQKLKDSASFSEAVVEAAGLRLRPILMTSMATALGISPIAFAFGSSATSRIPMGVAIIGGLLFSLLLTLYVIPAMYTLMSRKSDQLQTQRD